MSKVYFVATRHPEYADAEFDTGSTVIDPFRYIPDQAGVTVRRIGENKPELISLLVPSRGRPTDHARMIESAIEHATYPRRIEVVTYLDDDDPQVGFYWRPNRSEYHGGALGKILKGKRILLSEAWNECFRASAGEIVMHCGDDIVFRTPGWDTIVRQTFQRFPDRIVLVHGDDMSVNTDALATHGFLHRRWIETVGYFLPPLFSCDWNDVWLTEVADMIGRRVKVPVITEHMHYSFEKRPRDATDIEREERGREDGVVELFLKTKKTRISDAAKLKEAMA